jgi:hypothetical protein
MIPRIEPAAAPPRNFGRRLAHQYGLDEVQSSSASAAASPLDMAGMHYGLPHLSWQEQRFARCSKLRFPQAQRAGAQSGLP